MNVKLENTEIEINVVRLDDEEIEKHLRASTSVLHEIMCQDDSRSGPTCTHCGKIYKTENTLKRHVLLKHFELNEVKCAQCVKTYPSPLSLEKHIRYMHRFEHRCRICYRAFATLDSLTEHGQLCRKIDTPCKFCGKIYPSHLSLRNHIKYKHPAMKMHWCELCRRAFTSETHLVNHMGTVHPVGGTECWCGRHFTSLSGLQSHVLYKHTENNARCRHCHKVFLTNADLRRHLTRLHGSTVCETKYSNPE